MRTGAMPGPCLLCGSDRGVRSGGRWVCAVCAWPFGDVPDPDLSAPRIDVVYYIRQGARIKIGTSRSPRRRLERLWHEELLAFERGGREVEHDRHLRFASLRVGGEWFRADPVLLDHIAGLGPADDPWDDYARWVSEELRR